MINHIPLANVGLTNSINCQLSISDHLHLCPIMPTQWSMPESWDALKMVTDHWEYGNYCILVKYSLNNRSLALTAYIVLTFKASSNHELLMSHKLVRMLSGSEDRKAVEQCLCNSQLITDLLTVGILQNSFFHTRL